MSKKIFLLGLVASAILGWSYFTGRLNKVPESSPSPASLRVTQEKSSFTEISFEDKSYQVGRIEVDANEKLHLYTNLPEKQSAGSLKEKSGCQSLVSGGFYSKEDSSIGLLISEGEVLSKSTQNSLFNGYFSLDNEAVASIDDSPAVENIRLGLQSGPILIKDHKVRNLEIRTDEAARRIVVAVTNENEVVFLVFFDNDSRYAGPYLEDLPQIVRLSEEKLNLTIADAINLDGGTASAFYSEDISLSEVTYVGSYFCIK